MTLGRITLESFETDSSSTQKDSADYLRGYNDGLAHVAETQASELTSTAADIAATLNDMTFGFAEARVHILDRIRPLLAQIAETVLPEIVKETFAEHLIETLNRYFDTAMEEPIEITVSPEAFDLLQASLSPQIGNFSFVADTSVTSGQAILHHNSEHIMIDLPALLSTLQDALNGLESSERIQSNER